MAVRRAINAAQAFATGMAGREAQPRFMVSTSGGGPDHDWRAITWQEVWGTVQRLAAFLLSRGLGPGGKVAVLGTTRVEWAVSGLAVSAARAVLVPIYPAQTPAQIQSLLSHSGSEVLCVERDLFSRIRRIWGEIPTVRTLIVLGEGPLPFHPTDKCVVALAEAVSAGETCLLAEPTLVARSVEAAGEDDVACLFYTSGTTGDPKGVVLTNTNLHTNAEDWLEILGPAIPDERRDLLWLPLSHIFGWGELGLGNTLGFTTYMATPQDVLGLMPDVRPTIFMGVPSLWEKLATLAQEGVPDRRGQLERLRALTGGRLQFCLSGGAGLRRDVKEFFLEAGLLVIEGYGLTECSPTLTMNRPDEYDFDAVGKPFPRVEVRLAPDGEILAKGPNVFREYYEDAEATKAAFDPDGWFHTGDLGRWTAKGLLQLIGRKKEVLVTTGGKKIAPLPIELRLADDPYIEHLVLYGDGKKYLTALVTLKEAPVTDYATQQGLAVRGFAELASGPEIHGLVQARLDRVNADLAPFETIRRFTIVPEHLTVENGLLTPTLKVRRERVYDRYRSTLDVLYDT